MKFGIDWTKLKIFVFWLIGHPLEKLSVPVKCQITRKRSQSLIGQAYYFSILKGWKIKSPLTGIISKIYPNYAIQITNRHGLQIILSIQTDRKNPMPLNKILQCEVQEGQKVKRKTTLFVIYLEEQIISVTVYIPWQPEICGGIGKWEKNDPDCFVEIYRRNPYTKLQLKKHGKY